MACKKASPPRSSTASSRAIPMNLTGRNSSTSPRPMMLTSLLPRPMAVPSGWLTALTPTASGHFCPRAGPRTVCRFGSNIFWASRPKCFMRDGRPEDIGINEGRLDSPQGGQDECAHIFPCTESKQNFTVNFPDKNPRGPEFGAILGYTLLQAVLLPKSGPIRLSPGTPSGAD